MEKPKPDPGQGIEMAPYPNLTIGRAKELYREFGQAIYSDDLEIVARLRTRDIVQPISNENYLHALFLTDVMFRNTSESLLMLSGSAGEGFLACLRDSFVSALARIKKRDGIARLILLDPPDSNRGKEIQHDFGEPLKVETARTSAPGKIRHAIICDLSMTRQEQPHEPLSDDAPASRIKAAVHFGDPIKASVVAREFEAIWDLLTG